MSLKDVCDHYAFLLLHFDSCGLFTLRSFELKHGFLTPVEVLLTLHLLQYLESSKPLSVHATYLLNIRVVVNHPLLLLYLIEGQVKEVEVVSKRPHLLSHLDCILSCRLKQLQGVELMLFNSHRFDVHQIQDDRVRLEHCSDLIPPLSPRYLFVPYTSPMRYHACSLT